LLLTLQSKKAIRLGGVDPFRFPCRGHRAKFRTVLVRELLMRSEILRSFVVGMGWLLVGPLVGCYRPSLTDCQFRCSDDNSCPQGFSCNQGLCAHVGAPACSSTDLSSDSPDMQAVVTPPRLIAPLSTATVTQRQPTLRWIPGPATANVVTRVELCADRACKAPLQIVVDIAPDQRSARPNAALPSGWVFWRVAATLGSETAYSATWQMWVGKTSASSTVDSSAGTVLDVNGDGFADFLVGAPEDGQGAGSAHLFLGRAAGAPFQRIDLADPGVGGDTFGFDLAAAGDVNGDGFADFLIRSNTAGAAGSTQQYTGAVHLYLGGPNPSAADWNGPSAARRIEVESPDGHDNYFGMPMSAGDVNGDGYADFLVGPWLAERAHLFLGGPSPGGSDWSGLSAPKRIDLVSIDGPDALFGAVEPAGDINGDGYADFLVSAGYANMQAGASHLYLGGANVSAKDWNAAGPTTTRIDLASPDGMGAQFGYSVAAADFNGDGYGDVVISAPFAGGGGAAHLYLGSATPSAADWNGASPTRRLDMSNPDGANAQFGYRLAGAGDVDGDGYADFVVGANLAGAGGAAHLYLGYAAIAPSPTGYAGTRIDLINPDGAGARFGVSVSSAGDVDGDGLFDFLVGANSASLGTPGSNSGAVHLYVGGAGASADWNGAFGASKKRVDLPDLDSVGSYFGQSVARSTTKRNGSPGARAAINRRLGAR
jgi:hypothetical protein